MPIHALPEDAWLAPGFIDVQVNGGGDVLFNDAPTPEGIAAIVRAHRRFGTTSLLPTLISDTPAKMRAALDAVDAVVPVDPSVLGIHLEGPYLSPEKPGVHDRAMFRQPTVADRDRLTARRGGVTLVTLAPEQVPEGFVARLASGGRARFARPLHGDLCANQGRAGGRPHRVHAPLQRHAAAGKPRARPRRRRPRGARPRGSA